MKMQEWNPQQQQVILLLHPMFATADLFHQILAERLGAGWRYLIPDLAGHGGAADQTYQSAKREAQEIADYLKGAGIGRIHLAFGASLGGVVLLELLRNQAICADQVFLEGVSLEQNARLQGWMMNRIFQQKHKKAVADPALSVRKMKELYGEEAAEPMAQQMVNLRPQSIQNIVRDCSHVRLPQPDAPWLKRCTFAYGEKDGDLKKAKKQLTAHYPQAKLVVWPGYGHCQKMTQAPDEYTQSLKKLL